MHETELVSIHNTDLADDHEPTAMANENEAYAQEFDPWLQRGYRSSSRRPIMEIALHPGKEPMSVQCVGGKTAQNNGAAFPGNANRTVATDGVTPSARDTEAFWGLSGMHDADAYGVLPAGTDSSSCTSQSTLGTQYTNVAGRTLGCMSTASAGHHDPSSSTLQHTSAVHGTHMSNAENNSSNPSIVGESAFSARGMQNNLPNAGAAASVAHDTVPPMTARQARGARPPPPPYVKPPNSFHGRRARGTTAGATHDTHLEPMAEFGEAGVTASDASAVHVSGEVRGVAKSEMKVNRKVPGAITRGDVVGYMPCEGIHADGSESVLDGPVDDGEYMGVGDHEISAPLRPELDDYLGFVGEPAGEDAVNIKDATGIEDEYLGVDGDGARKMSRTSAISEDYIGIDGTSTALRKASGVSFDDMDDYIGFDGNEGMKSRKHSSVSAEYLGFDPMESDIYDSTEEYIGVDGSDGAHRFDTSSHDVLVDEYLGVSGPELDEDAEYLPVDGVDGLLPVVMDQESTTNGSQHRVPPVSFNTSSTLSSTAIPVDDELASSFKSRPSFPSLGMEEDSMTSLGHGSNLGLSLNDGVSVDEDYVELHAMESSGPFTDVDEYVAVTGFDGMHEFAANDSQHMCGCKLNLLASKSSTAHPGALLLANSSAHVCSECSGRVSSPSSKENPPTTKSSAKESFAPKRLVLSSLSTLQTTNIT